MPRRMTKYPKCQGEMEKGYMPGAWSWISDKKQINPREAKKNKRGFPIEILGRSNE